VTANGSSGHAFGLRVTSETPLPGLRRGGAETLPAVAVRLEPADALARRWSGCEASWSTNLGDGSCYRIERSKDEAHRIVFDERTPAGPARSAFLIEDGGRTIGCEVPTPDAPGWRRFLLDTVLSVASRLVGYEALHAAAVERAGEVVAVAAGTGSGKSSLVAELLRRGWELFTDDVLALGRSREGIVCHPGPSLMNLPDPGPRIGRVVGEFAGENWVEVESQACEAVRPAAICLLNRREDRLLVRRLGGSSMPLLALALDTGHDPVRRARRFHLVSDLATDVPILEVAATPTATPHEIADRLEDALVTLGAREVAAP
jgi:hypothetical protein